MNAKRTVGVLLVGLSIVFATFFLSWAQTRLGSMFQDYSFFLSTAGRNSLEFFFLLPLFFLFVTSPKISKYLQWLVGAMALRLVFSLVVFFWVAASQSGVLLVFGSILMDILLLYLMIRLFNDMSYPFVARALLLLWAMMSLTAFAVPTDVQFLVEQVKHASFFIGMMMVVNQLYLLDGQ